MIDDEVLEKRRNIWLKSETFRKRYIEIRTIVEGIYIESKNSIQLEYFTPHGVEHCKALEHAIYDLIPLPNESTIQHSIFCDIGRREQLTEAERFLLIISAWLHDLGMIKFSDKDKVLLDEQIRDNHHSRSEKYIVDNYSRLKLLESESSILGIIAYYHRKRCKIDECPEKIQVLEHDEPIRVRLLAAYIRLADAMHVDITRAPVAEYAILLTYNIPTSSKIHWLKSNFVLGISTDIVNKSITVIFKKPTDAVIEECVNGSHNGNDKKIDDFNLFQKNSSTQNIKKNIFIKTLDSIYKEIHCDLQDELDSVKEVLIRGNISCFLNIKMEICQVEIKDQFLKDIKTILHHYPSMDNPSGSSLNRIIIDTLIGIYESTKGDSDGSKYISSFLEDIKKHIIDRRQSYYGLENLYGNIRSIFDKKEYKRNILNEIIGNELRFEEDFLENTKNRIEKVKSEIRGIEDKYSDYKPLSELEIYLYFKKDKISRDVDSVRENSSIFFRKKTKLERCINVLDYLFSKDLYNIRFEEQKYKDKNERYSLLFEKSKINILLYGYSELSTKTLCGFRDAIIHELIGIYHNYVNKKEFLFHKVDIEKTASNFFRIFVCEGQPKNKIGWGGKVIFHDGTTYALRLHEYGFNNIYLIPDATVGSILSVEHPLDIHFVIMGANSYKEKVIKQTKNEQRVPVSKLIDPNVECFIHSAGHAMVAKLTQSLKVEIDKLKEENLSKVNKVKPKLIFAVTTDKLNIPEKQVDTTINDNPTEQENNKKDIKYGIEERDGLHFTSFYEKEPIKKRIFFAHNDEVRESIRSFKNEIMIYNPKEDRIPYKYVDYYINEIDFYPQIKENEKEPINKKY